MESATRCHRKRDLEPPELELEAEQKRLKSEQEEPKLTSETNEKLELEAEQKRLKSEQEEAKLTSETNESDSDSGESDSDESDSGESRCFKFLDEDSKARVLADRVYREKSRGLSRYDAIPRPPRTLLCGSSYVSPLSITEDDRPVLEHLSKIALDHYKKASGASFKFDRIVKCTYNHNSRPRVRLITNYYITFEAKAKGDPSDSPGAIATFQAKVSVDNLDKDKQPSVEECNKLDKDKQPSVEECNTIHHAW